MLVAGYELQDAGYSLLVTSYWLRVTGYLKIEYGSSPQSTVNGKLKAVHSQ